MFGEKLLRLYQDIISEFIEICVGLTRNNIANNSNQFLVVKVNRNFECRAKNTERCEELIKRFIEIQSSLDIYNEIVLIQIAITLGQSIVILISMLQGLLNFILYGDWDGITELTLQLAILLTISGFTLRTILLCHFGEIFKRKALK